MSDERPAWISYVLAVLDLATAIVKHYTEDHGDAAALRVQQLIAKQMQAMDVIVQHIEELQQQGKRDLDAAIESGRENAEHVETTIVPPDGE